MDCLACYVAGVSKCLSVRKDQVFLLQRLNYLYCNGCMLVNKSPTVMCLAKKKKTTKSTALWTS